MSNMDQAFDEAMADLAKVQYVMSRAAALLEIALDAHKHSAGGVILPEVWYKKAREVLMLMEAISDEAA